MASEIQGMYRQFTASGAIPRYTLCKLVAGTADLVAVCTVAEGNLAQFISQDVLATGETGNFRMLNAGGTAKVRVGEAIDLFDPLYCATVGEAKDTEAGQQVGIALETASGNDSVIEMLITPPASAGSIQTTAALLGTKLAYGVVALDGTNPTPVTTGLTTIVAAFAQINDATAEGSGDGLKSVQVTFSTGTLSIYGMESTSGADPTLVATSDATTNICWLALGV